MFLVVFLVMVTYHGRLVEVTSRLDFLWKQQAERELADMMESKHNNMQLLKNILPDHVAHHFLTQERAPEVRNYHIIVCLEKMTYSNFLFSLAGFVFSVQRKSWCYVCQRSKLY